MTVDSKGRELFAADNSVSGWTGLRYLEEWCRIAKAFDIAKEGDSWHHEKLTLKPLNPDFEPIALTGADEDELKVIAELLEVPGG